ncbi:hypothetical protein [Haladaptatus halobius]|nr:hypothetical protein [Haladaptatus halobius]
MVAADDDEIFLKREPDFDVPALVPTRFDEDVGSVWFEMLMIR